jgi:hypothetical protein
MPLARRTAIGLAALALAALTGFALPGTARADPLPPSVLVDKHSPGPGKSAGHGGTPPPSQPAGTPDPTVVPTDPPASQPPDPGPTTTAAPPGGNPGGAVATDGPGSPAGQPGGQPVDAGSSGDGGATLIGRKLGPGSQLAAANPSGSATHGYTGAHAERAGGLGATDTIRLGGAAVPLWSVVGGGALVVLLVATGLVLTLRDREKEPGPESVAPPEVPTSVKFG